MIKKWDQIEYFLNKIHNPKIQNQKFFLFGHEEGFEMVESINYGYLPFYNKEEVKVTVSIVPETNTTIRSNILRENTNYIVIHNTGMAAPSATAKGLDEYIHTTTREASWHYSLDDKEAFQQIPLDEVGWQAGDGRRKYGELWENGSGKHIGGGNLNGIGIESCVYAGVDFNMVLRNLAKLTSKLLLEYNLQIEDVKQHFHFSGKNCPQVIREANRWKEFIELVEIELYARKYLNDVELNFVSNNPDILDNFGKVVKHPIYEKEISYRVEVKYNNEKREFSFTSLLEEFK